MFLIYISLPVVLIVIIFIITITSPSIWGTFSIFIVSILMWSQADTFWKLCYINLGILSQWEALFTYIAEFILVIVGQSNPGFIEKNFLLKTVLIKNF